MRKEGHPAQSRQQHNGVALIYGPDERRRAKGWALGERSHRRRHAAVAAAVADVRDYIGTEIRALVDPDFIEALGGFLRPDTASQRRRSLLEARAASALLAKDLMRMM